MANRTLPLAAVLAFSLLAGCGKSAGTGTGTETADATANQTAAPAAPVALPPSIKESKVYRCADSSVVYVDFLSDGLGANFRTDSAGLPTHLVAPEVGKPFVADGYSVSGDGPSVTIAYPGKPAQTCKA